MSPRETRSEDDPARPNQPSGPEKDLESAPASGTPQGTRIVTIGAAADNDLIFDYPMISSYHARVVVRPEGVVLEDLNSTNGTYVNAHDRRISRAPLIPSDIVYLGSFRIPAWRLLEGDAYQPDFRRTMVSLRDSTITLGRDPQCDHVLDYPMISRHHARITQTMDGFLVEDMGSTNGTFVNLQRVKGPTPVLPEKDVVSLGTYAFTLTPSGEIEIRDNRGELVVEARDVGIRVAKNLWLIDRISLSLYPSEFVGLMGPSGAGKTTLMNALNGYTPPARGSVLVNGQDLYANYDLFRGQLGYVPQDDIIHRELTVGQALYYSARLRLPPDFSDAEIRNRMEKVIDQLGLRGTENVFIGSPDQKGISGGQRKRVNLAMELLTDPSVLFLDEPTSGLSSEDALMVMKLLRQLADTGKTILLTIHQPSLEAYCLMDNLVMVGKDQGGVAPGRLAYYGPAFPEAIQFFSGKEDVNEQKAAELGPEELMRGVARQSTHHWIQQYNQSEEKHLYVEARVGKGASPASSTGDTPTRQRTALFHQWWTLIRRGFAIKIRDRWNTSILLFQAPLIGLLLMMVFADHASGDEEGDQWFQVAKATATSIFMLSIMSVWCGCSNSAREFVGERAIYMRERMVNLKIPCYVASKLTLLIGLCVIQCAIMLGIVYWANNMQGPWVKMYGVLLLAGTVGVAIGLLVSVLAKTVEVAIAALPVVIMPMIVLGGVMLAPHELNEVSELSSRAMPSRWGFESLLVLEAGSRTKYEPPELPPEVTMMPRGAGDVAVEFPQGEQDFAERLFPEDSRYTPGFAATVLFGMLVANVIAMTVVLRWRDIH